jgi:hypothetical protein
MTLLCCYVSQWPLEVISNNVVQEEIPLTILILTWQYILDITIRYIYDLLWKSPLILGLILFLLFRIPHSA